RRGVEDDCPGSEIRRAVDRKSSLLATRDVDDLDDRQALLQIREHRGVVGSVRGDRLAPYRQPFGERAVEEEAAIAGGIDGHRARGERDEGVLDSAWVKRIENWEPAGE